MKRSAVSARVPACRKLETIPVSCVFESGWSTDPGTTSSAAVKSHHGSGRPSSIVQRQFILDEGYTDHRSSRIFSQRFADISQGDGFLPT